MRKPDKCRSFTDQATVGIFYASGPEALREIAEHESVQVAAFYRHHMKKACDALASNHFRAVNDLWAAFRLAEGEGQGELIDYSFEPKVRYDFRFNTGSSIERIILMPDARGLWHDEASNRDFHFLVEVDMGTERLEQIKQKVMKYLRLLLRLGWATVSGRPCFPLVLFVAHSARRAESIAGCFEAAARTVGVLPQDGARFAPMAVTDIKTIDTRGILAGIWSVPFEGVRGKRFDALLPPDHVCQDLRRHFAVENRKWSRTLV